MPRLNGFDYASPYFYMVTLKANKGIAPFSGIGPNGLVENEITHAFDTTIRAFGGKWRNIEEISPFVVMPDHIHLLVKLRPDPKAKTLPILVWQLERALSGEYWRIAKGRSPSPQDPALWVGGAQGGTAEGGCARLPNIFSPDWHDWIVKKQGQLAAFRRYIRENPARAWARQANAQYFQQVRDVDFLGRKWFAYGNPAILDSPAMVSIKGHRATAEGSGPWNAALEAASRIGPGGACVSTFMSPLEKACGNAIAMAGGRLIVLSPEGFSPRWHPSRDKEPFCAKGRMLFLSLYAATTRQPTRQELYLRCHEMIDLAVAGLSGVVA